MEANEHHQYAQYLFKSGRFRDAVTQMKEAVLEQDTAEMWNDLGAARMACSDLAESERAFRRALQLDPNCHGAAANLGVLLHTLGRWSEAVSVLEQALPYLAVHQQDAARKLIEQCQMQMSPALPVSAGSQ